MMHASHRMPSSRHVLDTSTFGSPLCLLIVPCYISLCRVKCSILAARSGSRNVLSGSSALRLGWWDGSSATFRFHCDFPPSSTFDRRPRSADVSPQCFGMWRDPLRGSAFDHRLPPGTFPCQTSGALTSCRHLSYNPDCPSSDNALLNDMLAKFRSAGAALLEARCPHRQRRAPGVP